jgi:glutamyl-tRNA synthetase
VKKLLENGSAYYCFCTDRRLELLRKDAVRNQQIPKYDNRCSHLTPVQIAEKLAKNDKFCVRFKLPSRGETIKDLVYGSQVYYVAQNEGDPVIIKSDGYPTYHLANVVDDHLMKITHVFRGVEWQISTPKHILMYRAFGWTPPQYGHLPLIINADGSKLSKRQNDVKLDYYRDKGILPHALLNYITQSGGGFNRIPPVHPKSYEMKELIEQFDPTRINTNSSRLNADLLAQFNRLELLKHLEDPEKCEQLIEKIRNLVKVTYPDSLGRLDLDRQHIENVLRWSVNRIGSLNDLVEGKMSFLWILPTITKEPHIDEGE